MSFVWETNKREAGDINLLIFVLCGYFNCRYVKVEAEKNSHLGPVETWFFRKLARLNPEVQEKYLAIQLSLATA